MKWIYILMFFAGSFGKNTYAKECHEVKTPQEKFCERPTDIICDPKVLEEKSKELRLFYQSKIVSSIHKNSHPDDERKIQKMGENQSHCLNNLENDLGFCEDALTIDTKVVSLLPETGIVRELGPAIRKELQKQVFERVNEDEEMLFETYEKSLKLFFKSYKDYIQNTFSSTPEKAKAMLKRFKRRAKNLNIFFGPTENSVKRYGKEKSEELSKAFEKICGSDGRTKNGAVSSRYDLRANKLVDQSFIICPSNYLTYSPDGNFKISKEKMMNKLLGILGHELGHINQDIDSANGAENYSCFKKNYRNSKRMDKNFKNYHHEIEADILSMRTMANYLRDKPISEKIQILQDSYSGLCGTQEGVEHPSGDYRLNQLLLKTPEIFRQFQCQKFTEKELVLSCKEGAPYPLSFGF